tara:strand:+ start:4983 stop:5636 length:654 start_codon:yes stop_codon:yes gene_type:complete
MKMKKIMKTWRETVTTINETTYSRLVKKIEDMKVPFVVMSGNRHEYSRNKNNERNKALKRRVKAEGYPFAEMDGSWVEEDEDGNTIRVEEKSLIIYDESRPDVDAPRKDLFALGQELSREFDQMAFIFGESGSKTNMMLINAYDQDGRPVDYGGPWTSLEKIPNDADFWSRVRGTTFVFKEEQEEVLEVDAPNSFIEAMCKANQHKGKKIVFVRKSK